MNNNNKIQASITPEQKLLLRASLLQGDKALQAWQKWRIIVDIERLDSNSYLLLPLLYRNLSLHNVEDYHLARLKGIYRRRWYENQLLLTKITELLKGFQEAEIKIMLTKDAALIANYYPDSGLKVIKNLGIFVAEKDALTAVYLISKQKWKPAYEPLDRLMYVGNYLSFENELGLKLTLYYPVCMEDLGKNIEHRFWKNSVVTEINNVPVNVLNPTNQLLLVLSQLDLPNSVPLLQILADTTLIINSSDAQIDWEQVLNLAKKRHLIKTLKDIVPILNELLEIKIPTSILQDISSQPISIFEKIEPKIIHRYPLPIVGTLLKRYLQYFRLTINAEIKFTWLGFLEYIQYVWELENLWQLPSQAFLKSLNRIKRDFKPNS